MTTQPPVDPMRSGPLSREQMRASDQDRQLVAELLNAAYAEGRITMSEHSERVDSVWQAKTMGDLSQLTADLTGSAPLVQYQSTPVSNDLVQPGRVSAPVTMTSVLSTGRREGPWHMPQHNVATVVMGEAHYDLREATFEARDSVIQLNCVMGEVKINVPEGVEVRDETGHLMSESKMRGLRPTANPSAVVTIRGFVLMGEVKVTGPDYGGPLDRWKKRK